jgi:hypothetical protein
MELQTLKKTPVLLQTPSPLDAPQPFFDRHLLLTHENNPPRQRRLRGAVTEELMFGTAALGRQLVLLEQGQAVLTEIHVDAKLAAAEPHGRGDTEAADAVALDPFGGGGQGGMEVRLVARVDEDFGQLGIGDPVVFRVVVGQKVDAQPDMWREHLVGFGVAA